MSRIPSATQFDSLTWQKIISAINLGPDHLAPANPPALLTSPGNPGELTWDDTGNLWLCYQTNQWKLIGSGGGGGGTVTSVGLALPAEFDVTGSPVVAAGTLTGAWKNQPAHYVLAGPTSGADALPTFRAIVAGDIPALPYLSSATTLPATYGAVASQFLKSYNSGTGLFTSAQAAFTDISGNIAVSQMNGGSGASAATFWRGDGIWASVSAVSNVVAPNASPVQGVTVPSSSTINQLTLATTYQNSLAVPIWIAVGGDIGGNNTVTGYQGTNVPPSTIRWQQQANYSAGANAFHHLLVPVNGTYRFTGGSALNTAGRFYHLPDLTDSGDLSGSRALGTVYQNTSGKTMIVVVNVTGMGANSALQAYSDTSNPPTTERWRSAQQAGPGSLILFVPNNHYYKVTAASGALSKWYEYQVSLGITDSGNLSGSRSANGTAYQNLTGKEILVVASWTSGATGTATGKTEAATPPAVNAYIQAHQASYPFTMVFVAYMNHYYALAQDSDGAPTLTFWYEYQLG